MILLVVVIALPDSPCHRSNLQPLDSPMAPEFNDALPAETSRGNEESQLETKGNQGIHQLTSETWGNPAFLEPIPRTVAGKHPGNWGKV